MLPSLFSVKKLFIPIFRAFLAVATLYGLCGVAYTACDPAELLANTRQPQSALETPLAYHQTHTPQGTLHWVQLTPQHHLQVAIASPRQAVESLGQHHHTKLLVNGGFFDPNNGLTVSHVVLPDGTTHSPKNNPRLTNNKKLAPYMPAISNRSELRQLTCSDGPRYTITPHSDTLPANCTLNWLLGGGPQLLPTLTAEAEAFWATDPETGKVTRDPTGIKRGNARTAVGITEDGDLIIALAQQPPHMPGWTLTNVATELEKLGATQVLMLDGGSSSSLWVNNQWVPGMWKNGEPVVRRIYSYLWLPSAQ